MVCRSGDSASEVQQVSDWKQSVRYPHAKTAFSVTLLNIWKSGIPILLLTSISKGKCIKVLRLYPQARLLCGSSEQIAKLLSSGTSTPAASIER